MSLSPEQLAIRSKGIGSSEIGAVVGLSPYRSAFDVWLEKTGQAAPFVVTPAMDRGTFLEPALRAWYAKASGASRIDEPGTLICRKNPLVIATVDGIAHHQDGARALEIKSPGPRTEQAWGREGTDEVPPEYLVQGAWHLAATDLERCDFAALISGELRIFNLGRDLELEGQLVERGERFWRDHVVTGKPPPVCALDTEWLKEHFPEDNGEVLSFAQLAPDAQKMVRDYLEAHETAKASEKRKEDLAATVRALMGEASMLEGPGFRIDWKANRVSEVTDWKGLCNHLEAHVPSHLVAGFRKAFTTTKPGARPLVPRKVKS